MNDPRLHPETVAFMEQAATIDMPVYGECSAEELRAASDRRGEIMPPAIEPVSKVIRRKIQGPGGEIPLRIYIPANAEPPYPVIMVFHGGGWTIRSYELEGPTSPAGWPTGPARSRFQSNTAWLPKHASRARLTTATPQLSGRLKTRPSSEATHLNSLSLARPRAAICQLPFRKWLGTAMDPRSHTKYCSAR